VFRTQKAIKTSWTTIETSYN